MPPIDPANVGNVRPASGNFDLAVGQGSKVVTAQATPATTSDHFVPAATSGPSVADITRFCSDALGRAGQIARLSTNVREGLYLLLRHNVPRENLVTFLKNTATSSNGDMSVEGILTTVRRLYDLHVVGVETGFIPSAIDSRFLSMESSRVASTLSEYNRALWVAQYTDAKQVRMGVSLDIDWSRMTPAELDFVKNDVLRYLPANMQRYAQQDRVELDMIVVGPQGSRILEVKRGVGSGIEQIAQLQLQIIRHGLLVRQHRLAGLELAIDMERLPVHVVMGIRKALDVSGVPHIVRQGFRNHSFLIQKGLSYDMRPAVALPTERALPELPAPEVQRKPKSIELSAEAVAKQEWWTDASRRRMRLWLSEVGVSIEITWDAFRKNAGHNHALNGDAASRILGHVRRDLEAVQLWEQHKDQALRMMRGLDQTFVSGATWQAIAQLAQRIEDAAHTKSSHAVSATFSSGAVTPRDQAAMRGRVETAVMRFLHRVEGDLATIAELFQVAKPHDMAQLRDELFVLNPDHMQVQMPGNMGEVTLRKAVDVIKATSHLGWLLDVAHVEAVIATYDRLAQSLHVHSADMAAQQLARGGAEMLSADRSPIVVSLSLENTLQMTGGNIEAAAAMLQLPIDDVVRALEASHHAGQLLEYRDLLQHARPKAAGVSARDIKR